jgi:hypothetical protein
MIKKLLSYLNAYGWDMVDPGMSKRMKQRLEDKDPQQFKNVVDGRTEEWQGCESYPALAQFVATGCLMSCHQPGVSLHSCSSP